MGERLRRRKPGWCAGYSRDALSGRVDQQAGDGHGGHASRANRQAEPRYRCERYSGGGFVIAQQLLLDMTGEPFPAFMKETVLMPAGMSHSTYEQPLPKSRMTEAAMPYRSNGQATPGGPHVYPEMSAAGL